MEGLINEAREFASKINHDSIREQILAEAEPLVKHLISKFNPIDRKRFHAELGEFLAIAHKEAVCIEQKELAEKTAYLETLNAISY